ncbi:hypothetical protein DH2020_026397 [Rehmannia glutinosa]|uniref:Conserved oligomeric Golgi complex subunit 1 n=1 Tax=Rehmannia glutinosa TaxID=99300 RepID=A0ABR0VX40_REHGL
MDSKQVLEGSLEWLKSVFGSEIELPWKRTHELVLGEDSDIWDDIFEDAFVLRMKGIIDLQFDELRKVVDGGVSSIVAKPPGDHNDFEDYLNRFQSSGGVWFMKPNGSPLFPESPNAPRRLRDLAPYVQNKSYESLSTILIQLKNELDHLYSDLQKKIKMTRPALSSAILVERSLFIGRLLFAFQKHARHIPVVLGSPRSWVSEVNAVTTLSSVGVKSTRVATDSQMLDSPGKRMLDSSTKQTSLLTAALFWSG